MLSVVLPEKGGGCCNVSLGCWFRWTKLLFAGHCCPLLLRGGCRRWLPRLAAAASGGCRRPERRLLPAKEEGEEKRGESEKREGMRGETKERERERGATATT